MQEENRCCTLGSRYLHKEIQRTNGVVRSFFTSELLADTIWTLPKEEYNRIPLYTKIQHRVLF